MKFVRMQTAPVCALKILRSAVKDGAYPFCYVLHSKKDPLMMNINEPQKLQVCGPGTGRAKLIRSSFFLYAKIAGAHKSSPAKGKEKGCSCESRTVHKSTSHGMI